MGKMHLLLVLAGATLLVPAVRATSFSASGGDGAFGVHADTALLPTLHADADYLRAGSDRGDAKVYGLGLSIAPPTPLLHWSIGARYQYQHTRWGDGGGVQVGASLFVDTPIPLLTVGGYGYYLPPGAAHGRVRHASDYGAQLRLGLTRSIYAWAGYRYMRASFEGFGTQTLYKGPSLGLSVGF